jgi:disulfide oxidoreductase YuzD
MPEHKVVAFMRKYQRVLVTLVGTLTVLVTFFVKEALRENEKEIADGIESAELFYRVEELSYDVRASDMRLSQDLYSFSQSLTRKGRREPGVDFASSSQPRDMAKFITNLLERDLDSTSSNINNSEEQLGMIHPLLEQLPNKQQEEVRYLNLQNEVKTKKDQLVQFANTISDEEDLDFRGYPHMVDTQVAALANKLREQENYGTELLNSTARTGEALGHLTRDVIRSAQAQKEGAIRRYTIFTYLTYVLYPVGVFIAVIGQYYKGEEIVEMETE